MELGIRKKVLIGFLGIALLMFCSGMFSLFELSRLSHKTRVLLDISSRNIEISRSMLDAVQDQNTALLQMIVLNDSSYDSLFVASKQKIDQTLDEAIVTIRDLDDLDSIFRAYKEYELIIGTYNKTAPKDNIDWFVNVYKTSYFKLTTSIKNYMSESQSALGVKASQLEKNAYRTITPNLITLSVLILIIVMFMFFIDIYVIKPLVGMNRGVSSYLNNKIPFNIKVESKDEILSLKENIEKLIAAIRKKNE